MCGLRVSQFFFFLGFFVVVVIFVVLVFIVRSTVAANHLRPYGRLQPASEIKMSPILMSSLKRVRLNRTASGIDYRVTCSIHIIHKSILLHEAYK